MAINLADIVAAWHQVGHEVAAAQARRRAELGREQAPVTLVVVTKRQPVEHIMSLYDAGQRHFAENYVQPLLLKRQAMLDSGRHAQWHLIGGLQRNKVSALAHCWPMVQSVDSLPLGHKMSERARQGGTRWPVLMQVRLSDAKHRAGVSWGESSKLFLALIKLCGLRVQGIMGLPGQEAHGPSFFARLHGLAHELWAAHGLDGAPTVSMGMSDDFREAIHEGATMVRVGSRIFGGRSIS